MFTASPYKLNTYKQCPAKYKYIYLDGLADRFKEAKPYLTMGAHVHNALHDFYKKNKPEERSSVRLEEILRRRWTENRDGFRDREDEHNWGMKALNMLRLYARENDFEKTPAMLEDYYEMVVNPKLKIMGRIDRVDEEEGGFHVIDYKTGQETQAKNNLQLLLYGLIMQNQVKGEVSKVSYLFLSTGHWYTINCSEDDYQSALQETAGQVKIIKKDAKFVARTGSLCANCEFRSICPAGKKYLAKTQASDAQNIFAPETGRFFKN